MKKINQLVDNFVRAVGPSIGVGIGVYSVASILLLVLDIFTTFLAIMIAVVAMVVATIFYRFVVHNLQSEKISKTTVAINYIILLLISVWIGVNVTYSFETTFIRRDPGMYANGGVWLIDNTSTNIPVQEELYKNVKGASADSSGIWYDPYGDTKDYVQPQGVHSLSAYLALFGKIFGEKVLFDANIYMGAAAIMTVFAVSRLFVSALFAGVGATVMMASLPMVYFSRDTYTEPMAILLAMTAIFSFSFMLKNLSEVKLKHLPFWVTGMISGGVALARSDGYIVAIGVMLTLMIIHVIAKNVVRLKQLASFLAGSFAVMMVAYADLYYLTGSYHSYHGKDVHKQMLIMAVLLSVFGLLLLLPRLKSSLGKLYRGNTKKVFYTVSAILILMVVFIVSRPLWHTGTQPVATAAGYVNSIQAKVSEPISNRNYAENTHMWITWYIGASTVILGLVGIWFGLYYVITKQRYEYLALVILVLGAGFIYMMNPRITSDQIWAIRRFLPIVVPLTVVFATLGLMKTSELIKRNVSDVTLQKMGMTMVIGLVLVQPLVVTRPFIKFKEIDRQLESVKELCKRLPENSVAVWVHTNTLERNGVQSTRNFCNTPSYGLNSKFKKDGMLDAEVLSQVYEQASKNDKTAYLMMHGKDVNKLVNSEEQQQAFTAVAVYGGEVMEKTLTQAPNNTNPYNNSVEMAKVISGGKIVSISE